MTHTLKRRTTCTCASTFLSVVGVLVASSHSAPADNGNCQGCQVEKIYFAVTGDPDIDRASLARAEAAAKKVQRRNVAKAAARKLARMNVWQGTKVVVGPSQNVTLNRHSPGLAVGNATEFSRIPLLAGCSGIRENSARHFAWTPSSSTNQT